MGLVAIRAGIVTRLDTISGLRVSHPGQAVSTPGAQVGDTETDYDLTMGGRDQHTIKIRVYASKADDKAAAAKLDAFCDGSGASSVKAAIEGDTTLGGTCDTLRVTGMTGYGAYEVSGVLYLGAEFTVTVIGSGN